MAKHRRFSDTPKPDSVQKDEEIELVEQETPSKETSTNIKSILLSGSKYAYIIAAVALLSGIFTPLTVGEEFEIVARINLIYIKNPVNFIINIRFLLKLYLFCFK